ncbi:MAG: malate dehydrogenase (quinone) [Flavobacteriaceae bacterium]|nr:MAG: malate dehydrogenase (quinone) [Flavobacteriaceae bacterium]
MITEDKNKVLLVGTGIMSVTLGVMLNELDPSLEITFVERLDKVSAESSDAWNNAGTGHSAFCELNYTPEKPDGTIDVEKAIRIAGAFETSKVFWSYLVEKGYFKSPKDFIHKVPHCSFVFGEENRTFLKKRFETLKNHVLFEDMEYTEDPQVMHQWFPLMVDERKDEKPLTATKVEMGTDVNFGDLTRYMLQELLKKENVTLHLETEVKSIRKRRDNGWKIRAKNLRTKSVEKFYADFVFIGAGGGALELIDDTKIPEGNGYGGFPISGQWLVCTNPEVIEKHNAKVYGLAEVGAPPMSVPHLDTRVIDGKKALLFGPFAGFNTKFLINGSYMDLLNSVELDNILPMLNVGRHNFSLVRYLVDQVRLSKRDKIRALRQYFPAARYRDWEMAKAGQRVQIIKKDKEKGGILEFGTEIITNDLKNLAGLLGASPGASTSVSIAIEVIEKCFSERVNSGWKQKLESMIPVYGKDMNADPTLCRETREKTTKILQLN